MTRSTARGRSRRSVEPGFVAPMECTKVEEIPDDPSKWIYEVKLDGYRCCAVVRKGNATLYSRYGNPWPERWRGIHEALAELEESVVLDGEIVAVDKQGRPSFSELQNWQSTKHLIVFYVFDITKRGGRDLKRLPLEERKEILADVARAFHDPIRMSAPLDADLRTLIPQMKKMGLEGIVAKRRGSLYQSGRRSPHWLKHRFNEVEEFFIGGYIPEDDSFSRLLIGKWKGDELMFVKKLKNGFSEFARRQIMKALRGLEIDENPFANLPEKPGRSAVDAEVMKSVQWVRPVRKVEAEFVEWTGSGKLRHAFFRRLV